MLHYYRTNPEMRIEVRTFVLMLLLACGFVAYAVYQSGIVRQDVVVYESVCRQMTANTTTGRQALVCSVWWAPLPFLLRWPFSFFSGVTGSPLASFLVSALFGAGCLFLMERVLRRVQLGWWRFVAVAGLCVQPAFLTACTDGSNVTTTLFFSLLCAASMAEWIATRQLRFLVRFAYASAFLCGINLEMAAWLIVPLGVLCVDLLLHAREKCQRQATLIVALLPLVYGVGLWVLLNWLIMGDGLFFVRAFNSAYCLHHAASSGGADVLASDVVLGGVAVTIALLCALRRCRAGAYMGLFAAAPLVIAYVLRAKGLLWSREPVLFTLFPLVCLSAGYAGGLAGGFVGKWRGLLAVLPLVGGMWLWIQEGGAVGPAESGVAVVTERWEDVPARVARRVMSENRHPKVFVCGYEGFVLMRGYEESGLFVHALDFDFDRVESTYRGQKLFVLVRRPAGRGAMESVHWKYDEMFHLGDRSALIDSDWGDWRLFEIIQAPRG